jgi:hypothetical protein
MYNERVLQNSIDLVVLSFDRVAGQDTFCHEIRLGQSLGLASRPSATTSMALL